MNLSPHFSLEELTVSQEAVRMGLDNTPDPMQVNNLREVATTLEQVRHVLGDRPIVVSSGFRSPQVNHLVGGSDNSAHLDGLAADFICPAFGTPIEVARAIVAAGIEFDQLIFEGTWVHLGLAGGALPRPRRQVLTAFFSPGRKTTYLSGLVTVNREPK